MNEYEIAARVGICIGALWIVAYIFSWIVQWCWAWIDDSEIGESNWVVKNLEKFPFSSKWKYPVYNDAGTGLENKIKYQAKPFGFAKDKEHNNKSVHGLRHGTDYKYDHEVEIWILLIPVITSITPLAILVAVKTYPVTLTVITLGVVAHLARFVRRNKKMFDEHTQDKNAHG